MTVAGRYAKGTNVSVDRSKAEIERALKRYGATGFGYMTKDDQAVIGFVARGRALRVAILLPAVIDYLKTPKGKKRAASAATAECAREERRRWRALLLVVRAKLEAVEAGVATFEAEWLPYVVLPNGRTVAEHVQPEVSALLASGSTPGLLLLGVNGGT